MKKSLLTIVALALLGTVRPLVAGTVYVPMAGEMITPDGNEIRTEVIFHNATNNGLQYSYLFIPAMSDGTLVDRERAIAETVLPRVTSLRADLAPNGQFGFLEIKADDDLAITARIVTTSDQGVEKIGVDLPVVTSRNAVSAQRTAVIQGLERLDGKVETDFFMFNLSIERTTCQIDVRRRGGLQVFAQTVVLPPLSLFPFEDVFGLLDIMNASDNSITVTCDALAHPFAITRDVASADVLFIPPAAKGAASLDLFPTSDCPADAALSLPGVFHVPTAREPRAVYVVPTTAGQRYSRITLTMEFTHGGWSSPASGNHGVFWLNRTPVWSGNVFGYLNLFGPNRNIAKLTTNVDLPRAALETVEQGAVFQPGETYAVSYVYDTSNRFVEAVISVKGGGELVRLTDAPTVRNIVAANEFVLIFGHGTDEAGPEVPSFGWEYANLCLTLE